MKRFIKSLTLVALFASYCIPSWAQAPSTEGQDFWVTFLQWNQDAPGEDKKNRELKLTISAVEECDVQIVNPSTGFSRDVHVPANSSVEEVISKGNNNDAENNEKSCYIMENETPDLYRALHVTSTKTISLFAGNYLNKSFDAANVLPTPALLDDYLIQTYPPSDHEDKPQGSHFAIIAVEDGETTVDYNLTAKTAGGKTGAQSVTLKKGQVWYVWTGKNKDDAADLSGTTVKARDGKKIAVFQGCPHTNVPDRVRDRDHLFSQAMPTAYWGSEFAITTSRKHRRDIVAVMAINDGTEVYINSEDGEPQLVHTFNFNSSDPQERKHYWTFEIGEFLAYCADDEGQSPSHGQLPPPLIVDSSCYITTSCPAGVHLFMVSNRYDNVVPKVKSDTLVDDPAMLWISPIEQVIKQINFATYQTKMAKFHYMNIVTPTADINDMVWTDQNGDKHNIAEHFHPVRGTDNEYSFARIEIQHGSHNLKGKTGFLAHVYGYGERESYAYSCGSSTIQRSISFNDTPLEIDSISKTSFCVNEEIEMKLNIGNNDYQSVHWDYGDGVTYDSDPDAPNSEKKMSTHTYTSPGWYDLKVTAVYRNPCTGTQHTDPLGLRFYVSRPDTIRHTGSDCVAEDYSGEMVVLDTMTYGCDSVVITQKFLHRKSSYEYSVTAEDAYTLRDSTYTTSTDVTWTTRNSNNCDSTITCHIQIVKCLNMQIENKPDQQFTCAGQNMEIPFSYSRDGGHLNAYLYKVIQDPTSPLGYRLIDKTQVTIEEKGESEGRKRGLISLPVDTWRPGYYVGCIQMEDANCKITEGGIEQPAIEQSTALNLTIKYPENIIAFKFNNVLAVYQSGFGGNKGYDFVAYQWYRNNEKIDALKNPSAATSIYHSEEIFTSGDEYYVVLTESGKDPLASCSFTVPDDLDNYDVKKEDTFTQEYNDDNTANKKMIDNRICVEIEGRIYDMYGQRVK